MVDYTLIWLGLAGAVFFFGLQMLFFWARRTAIKLIPVYLTLLGFLFCLATWLGLFGQYSLGAIAGHQVVALILLVIMGISALGEIAAWGVYGILRRKKSSKTH